MWILGASPPSRKGVGGVRTYLWGAGKTTLFVKHRGETVVKLTFYEIVISRAVRRGDY